MTVDPKKKKSNFNVNAYKHAIGMVESSGGKNLESSTSSASGRYQFLYNSIKHDPDMEGVTKRQFINNPELQELIMDKALNGKLKGYTYGTGYAERLKGDYDTEHDIGELTALVHFLGPGNTRKYLKDPTTFKVPGKNASPQTYIDRFSGYINDYKKDNPKEFVSELTPPPLEGGKEFSAPQIQDERFEQQVAQDNTYVQQPAREMLMEQEGTPASRLANMFNMGGHAGGEDASEQVIQFEGGGTHEQNPNGGIKVGTGSNGKPNLVEEGETKWNDYIFSNSIDLDGNFSLGEISGNVFAEGGSLTEPTGTKPTPGAVTASMVGPKTEIESRPGVDDTTKFGYIRPDEGESSLRNPQGILKEANWQSMDPIAGTVASTRTTLYYLPTQVIKWILAL